MTQGTSRPHSCGDSSCFPTGQSNQPPGPVSSPSPDSTKSRALTYVDWNALTCAVSGPGAPQGCHSSSSNPGNQELHSPRLWAPCGPLGSTPSPPSCYPVRQELFLCRVLPIPSTALPGRQHKGHEGRRGSVPIKLFTKVARYDPRQLAHQTRPVRISQ